MTEHIVKKPFTIVNRRLQPGDIVTIADDLYPFAWGERIDNGFIEVKAVEEPAAVALAPAAPPAKARVSADKSTTPVE